jgi:hypothetical protein
MYYYVNHQAMNEVFKPIEVETDPQVRIELIDTIESEFANRITMEYERTCYELKQKNWSTGQIAEALSISERKVKMLIRWYSERTGEWNPLQRRPLVNVIDISHLVAKSGRAT